MSCQVSIRGIPHIPSVTEINARSGPGTQHPIVFRAPVGAVASTLHTIESDVDEKGLDGKTYLWFQLSFEGLGKAWVRDDLLNLQGDCTIWGYDSYTEPAFAFALTRRTAEAADTPTDPQPEVRAVEPPPAQPIIVEDHTPPPVDDLERVRRAAFAVTAAFEGHGYSAYQNYDAGVISYGRFQFTLDAGTLNTVVTRYLQQSRTPTAQALERFQRPIQARDHSLRNNQEVRRLLIAAADEDVMKRIQNAIAQESYWNRMLEISARPRGIQSPLGLALLFDIAINFGVMNALLGLAEDELGVPRKSRVGDNGVTEKQFIAQVADRRKRGHYAQAERDNLPGLKVRGDFWVNLAQQGDWGFQGDAAGNVVVNGRAVQVQNPTEF